MTRKRSNRTQALPAAPLASAVENVVETLARPQNRKPTNRSNRSNVNINAARVVVRRPRYRRPAVISKASDVSELISLPALVDEGRVTQDNVIHEVAGDCIHPSEGALGFFHKYLDPAGSVEAGRAIGEFTKIPDGLLRFSVDAEQRPIVTEEVPGGSDAAIPLDGQLWSISFISFPCFRLNYIAVANTDNALIDELVSTALLSTLNNLADWRLKADGAWRPFLENWFYKIRVLPNTFAMAEDAGRTNGVTQFRKTYKGITFEFNAPTLLDQGWWAGGHVPVKPRNLTIPASEDAVSSFSLALTDLTGARALAFTLTIPDPGRNFALTGAGSFTLNSPLEFTVINTTTTTVVTWETIDALRTFDGTPWALAGDTITLTVNIATGSQLRVTLSSSLAGSIDILSPTMGNSNRRWTLEMLTATENTAVNKLSIEMPSLTSDELTTNNPKIEQFLCKESGGAYIVHYKMNNPVFEMTGEENFGFFQFHYPSYAADDVFGQRGIQDTFENNFSSAVVHFWGISKSASIVAKTYDGWEGTTSTSSTVGQFAHTGAQEETEIIQLAGDLQAELTGVYPADDNFAALVSTLAGKALGAVMKSSATPSIIKSVAQQAVGIVQANPEAVETAVSTGINVAGGIATRLVQAIKARRARRRARNA